jgi:2-hydroxychromene-2-carboxylate isomerase
VGADEVVAMDDEGTLVGLDPAETRAALREQTFRDRVLADVEGGRRAGVHATPTFFVDGERLDRPWHELPQIVRARLASA